MILNDKSIFSKAVKTYRYIPSNNAPNYLNDPYGLSDDSSYGTKDADSYLRVFKLEYLSENIISTQDELERQIANDYMKKTYGVSLEDIKIDKQKEIYPELFLI
jgi:hypothetical protein